MPNFIKFGITGACRQYGEMYTLHTLFYIFDGIFLGRLYRKNNWNFSGG